MNKVKMMSMEEVTDFTMYMRKLLFAQEPQEIVIKMKHGTDMLKCPGGFWIELSAREMASLIRNNKVSTEDENGNVTRCLPPRLRDLMQPWRQGG